MQINELKRRNHSLLTHTVLGTEKTNKRTNTQTNKQTTTKKKIDTFQYFVRGSFTPIRTGFNAQPEQKEVDLNINPFSFQVREVKRAEVKSGNAPILREQAGQFAMPA